MFYRCYPISDVWLTSSRSDAPAYIDLDEIRQEPTGNVVQPDNLIEPVPDRGYSEYLTWILQHDPNIITFVSSIISRRLSHIRAACFQNHDAGIRVGNVTNGNTIRGILKDAESITTGEYSAGEYHEDVYRRIYREGTTVGRLWFVMN